MINDYQVYLSVKKALARQRYEHQHRYKYYRPVTSGWLWTSYVHMCATAHIKLMPLWISRNETPNAEYCFNGNIVLTHYDMEHFDKSSILVLLGHEVGHAVCRQDISRTREWQLVWISLLQLSVFIAFFAIESTMHAVYGYKCVSVIKTFLLIGSVILLNNWLTDKQYRSDELYADEWAARLAGMSAVKHLFRQIIVYEKSEQLEILQVVKDLWTVPSAALLCLWKYARFQSMLFKRTIGFSNHPTYHQRIKHLDKGLR